MPGIPEVARVFLLIAGCMSHPLGQFSMLDISIVGIESVPKMAALETFRRELSEDVSFGIVTLLVVEQWSLESRPKGCDIHRRIRW